MGRTREKRTIQPDRERADEHLELQFERKGTDTDYFRDWTRLLTHARPGRKGDLLCEWQILRIPDRVPRSFKGVHRHCVGERNPASNLAGWKARDLHHVPRKR